MCVMCVSVYGLKLWNGLPVLTSEVALTKYFPLLIIIIIDYHSLVFFLTAAEKTESHFVILTDCNSHPWPLGGNEHIVTFPYETAASFLLLLIEVLHRPRLTRGSALSRPHSHALTPDLGQLQAYYLHRATFTNTINIK